MRKIKVTAPKGILLHQGKVKLTPAQASARAHCLHSEGGGVYTIMKETMFKVGEVLEWDGVITKTMADECDPAGVETPPPAKPPAPTPKKKK